MSMERYTLSWHALTLQDCFTASSTRKQTLRFMPQAISSASLEGHNAAGDLVEVRSRTAVEGGWAGGRM